MIESEMLSIETPSSETFYHISPEFGKGSLFAKNDNMDAMFIAIAVKILVNYSVNSHKFCGLFHMYFLSSG